MDGIADKTVKVLIENNYIVEKVTSDLQTGLNEDLYPVAVKRFSRYMKQLS